MAKAVKSTQDDLLFIKVKAILVTGNGSSGAGNVHNIVVFPNNQEHMVIPSRFYNSLRSTIERVMSSNNNHDQKFTIDTALKDDDNLCDDFSSMGLSIAVGIGACLNNWKEMWENVWEEWCFSGEVKDSQGVIGGVGGTRAKLKSAIDSKIIRHILIPSENRQEAINWINQKQDIDFKINPSRNIDIENSEKSPFFFSRLWSLSTRNIFMWIALIIWSLSVAYLPIRFLLWDNIQSSGLDNSLIAINLPVKNPRKVKEKLIRSGFPRENVKDIPLLRLSKRFEKTNQTGRILIKNRDGTIEFEIADSRDLTLILNYICIGYIVLYTTILIIISLRRGSGNIKSNSLNMNYDSVHLTDKDKEIVFVDNIKQAEAIIKYKIH